MPCCCADSVLHASLSCDQAGRSGVPSIVAGPQEVGGCTTVRRHRRNGPHLRTATTARLLSANGGESRGTLVAADGNFAQLSEDHLSERCVFAPASRSGLAITRVRLQGLCAVAALGLAPAAKPPVEAPWSVDAQQGRHSDLLLAMPAAMRSASAPSGRTQAQGCRSWPPVDQTCRPSHIRSNLHLLQSQSTHT